MPDDERFQRLDRPTKEMLFWMYLDTPVLDAEIRQMKESYRRKADVPVVDEKSRVVAKDMGIDLDAVVASIKGSR